MIGSKHGVHRHHRRAVTTILVALVVTVLAGCAWAVDAPPTGVSGSGATLRGNVYDNTDGTVSYWFDYGPTTAYGNQTTHRSIVINDRDPHAVSESVGALNAGTIYHYRICAQLAVVICDVDQTLTTSGFATQLAINAAPALYPSFNPTVSDYVTRCNDSPVAMSVAAPQDTTVSINGGAPRSGAFSQDVSLTSGKSFTFSTTTGAQTTTFHVRCLPNDFPDWTYSRPGTPSAAFYITTPVGVLAPGGADAAQYVAIFDNHGVPVWWTPSAAIDAKLLPDGTLGWATQATPATTRFEQHTLDGSLVKTWTTVGTPFDIHDFQPLSNGNALLGSYRARPGTLDLTPYGGPSTNGTPLDPEIQEIKPDGTVAWSWNAKDFIALSETPVRWRASTVYSRPQALSDGRNGFDWAHMNSFQEIGNTIVVSFRHLDAVYAIDKSTGSIIWKLGGTTTPKSLTFVDDPEANPLGGQHYARTLSDGTLTIHDNNTNETAAPRAVRYRLDLAARTATLLESLSDPDVHSSACCGSAAKLADGSWLMSWGGTPVISEFSSSGARHFELAFRPGTALGFSYRVDPITTGGPTRAALRAGMDAMP
jgi:hypothetical protein